MLAIIIPYYKLTFFEATLQSLSNQTNQRFKVYIGDDASPENPATLLEKFKEQFDFRYHRFETNLGGASLVKQWERCIVLSDKEEWIMILGDDDVLGENVVENFYKNLKEIKLNFNVVRFASCKIDREGNESSSIYHSPKIGSATDIIFKGIRSSLSEYVFTRNKIVNIGFKDFPLAWYSDVLAVLEFSNFKDVFSINEAVVYIRISNLSISGNQDNNELKSKAKFYFYSYLLNNKLNKFSNDEKKELFLRFNKCYINNKKEFEFLMNITVSYLTRFLPKELLKFYFSIFFGLKKINIKYEKRGKSI
jgi:glycosyltransferase involved in cell wall biosynthesis